MTLSRVDGYIVSSPTTGTATISALDGSGDSFSPVMVTRWDSESESANIVHPLIDNSLAVTLVGDRLPSGTLAVLFVEDAAMLAAREILGRRCAFSLVDTSRPAINMTFSRQGALTPGMHDEARNAWEFKVGFQEVDL